MEVELPKWVEAELDLQFAAESLAADIWVAVRDLNSSDYNREICTQNHRASLRWQVELRSFTAAQKL